MIPSLLQIPSAVSDSKLHSVLPNNGKGDFTFDRSTGATRINKDGLIEEVGYFSSELVQNGNFSELGSELITNGDFATDSNWGKGIGWSINNGVASCDGTQTSGTQLTQTSLTFTNGKTYKVVFTCTIEAGNLDARLQGSGATVTGDTVTTSGTYTQYLVSTGNTSFRMRGNSTFIGTVDNVSVKQVDPNDRFELDSASYGQNKVTLTSVGGAMTYIKQTGLNLEANKTYLIKINATKLSGDTNLALGSDGTNNVSGSPIISTSGFKRYYFTPASDIAHIGIKRNFGGSGAVWEITSFSIVEVQGDRPRLSYDITNGVVEDKPHLLLEPSSTNLITFSNDYTQTFWLKHQSGTASTPIVTSNYAISPDGTRNADRVIFNLNQATDSSFSQLAASLTTSVGNVTNSVYIKSNTDSNYIMNFTNQIGANNLITVTNEWQRFEITLNNTGTSSVFRIRLRGTESTSKYADVSIFGAQLEQQAFATSFIPTAGTTITRSGETCNNSKPSVNSTEGVLYCEIAALTLIAGLKQLALTDGTNANNVKFSFRNTAEQISVSLRSNNTDVSNLIKSNATTTTNFFKVAIKYKLNDVAVFLNGTEILTDTSVTMPIGLNTLTFDRGDGSNKFEGKVKGLAVYNEALSESQLMQLTGVTASSIYNNFVTRTASFTVEALNEVKKVIDNL